MRYKISKIIKVPALFSLVILLFTTMALAAEATSVVTQAMYKAGFTELQVEKVESTITSAQKVGIPNDVMVGKLMEGIAKQVAPEKITQAIERIASRYNYAYSLAKQLVKEEKKTAQLGKVITSGITAGLTLQHAETLIADLKSEQKPGMENYSLAQEAMLMARDLSRRGVTSATTVAVVEQALQKGLGVSEIQTMRSKFNQSGGKISTESLARGYLSVGQGYGTGTNSGIGGAGASGDGSGSGSSGSGSSGSGSSGSGGSGSGGSGSGGSGSGGGHR